MVSTTLENWLLKLSDNNLATITDTLLFFSSASEGFLPLLFALKVY